ncbi:TetR/AcrR family transcriptional regulator [Limobrevibacterium gyesilva]|uniref:TetR family transcriptional regulator n=1 Tax=Limobrevibacterium gyesilva TaxID=2991712 RepID=A0AA42CFZ4_9PROT|nr:TetR/AcrR family transcriptional regulator [Limobrevibacterium gyesilva]MCW3477184.1 TetR family transcriptional regulator [Limobrevibacterium gyesilva]
MSVSTLRLDVPSGPKAESTRAAIVETAEQLFRTLGYQKTAVADIARALKMSPANIYRFFPSKAAINEAICARIVGGLSELAWQVARGPGSAADRLRLLFQTLQQQTMALAFREKRMHDMVAVAMDEHWAVIKEHVHAIDTALRHIVMDGQASGEFARLDPDATGRLLHATMIGFSHPTVMQQCMADDLPAMARDMAEFCLRALRPDH